MLKCIRRTISRMLMFSSLTWRADLIFRAEARLQNLHKILDGRNSGELAGKIEDTPATPYRVPVDRIGRDHIIISMSKYVNLSGSARDVICSAGSGPTSVVVCVEWCGVRRFSFRFRLAGGG